MPRTSCKVHMEFIDTSAIADSNISTEDNAGIGNLELLKSESVYPAYLMIDRNSFLLDGSRSVMDEKTQLPFISAEVSQDDCNFSGNPTATVSFSSNHTSAGITLTFIEDYPAELNLTWYNLAGVRIITKTYYPDKLHYFCKNQVANYGKLQIEFVRTRLPGQRVKLGYIKYGTEIDWTSENIKNAALSEEVDMTGATLPISTGNISIIDVDNDFDLFNQDGAWKSIQKRQPLVIKEDVGDKEITCGTLFLDTWKSQRYVITFSLIDIVGLMDKTKFYGGRVYVDEPAGNIIASIMASAGIENYSVSDEISSILLTGHIPICTHRAALQQVLFACGAVADSNRAGGVHIYRPSRQAANTVGTDRKFIGTTIEIDSYVSGVAITYSKYKLSTEEHEIYNDMLLAGDTLLEFSEPHESVVVTGGTIVESSVNYVVVHMDTEGECTVTGLRYEKTEVTYTANVDKLDAGEEPNVITFGNCTLLSATRAKEIAEQILNYYQLRQIVSFRYLIDEERTGEWINVRDIRGNTSVTGIVNQTIDLTGGFIASAKCRGYSKVVTSQAFTGEFYTGERGLI